MTSDDQLIEGCKDGKRHAFNMLYKKYAPLLLGVCLRYSGSKSEAEDVLQEGFIKVFKNIKGYEGRGSFEGWLKRIMVNTAINQYKLTKKHKHHEEINSDRGVSDENDDGYIDVYGDFSQEQLMSMINSLPVGYRMVFNLYVFEGMSHKEISEIMDFQESTSKSQLSKARRLLRTRIQEIQLKRAGA